MSTMRQSSNYVRRVFTGNVMLLGKLNHQLGNILHGRVSRPSHPDVVKSTGNQKYKQRRYEEALALYDRAISIDSNTACYYDNKAAALIGLGRLVEAVFQCREAVRIDSSYYNAHCRLAKLYMRLGVAEKAVCLGTKGGLEILRTVLIGASTVGAMETGEKLYEEFLGPIATWAILQVRALVYMANGRLVEHLPYETREITSF